MNFRNIKSIDSLIKKATEFEEEELPETDENESEFNDPEIVEMLFRRFNQFEKQYKKREITLAELYDALKFEIENQYDPNILQKYEETKIKRRKP